MLRWWLFGVPLGGSGNCEASCSFKVAAGTDGRSRRVGMAGDMGDMTEMLPRGWIVIALLGVLVSCTEMDRRLGGES